MSRALLARYPVDHLFVDFAAHNIAIGTWFQIIAAMGKPISAVQFYNGSGSIIKISVGAIGSESSEEIPYYIPPGQSEVIAMEVSRGLPISITAVDAAITDGSFVMNCFG